MQSTSGSLRTGLVVTLIAVYGGFFAADACDAQTEFEIELQPDLVIGEASGISFGDGLRVAVNSDGRIYVGDWMNMNVRVFSADGELLETIGRSGKGPGEFMAIHGLHVGRGDSLYVWDANTRRVSVYAPGEEHALAYTFTVATVDGLGFPSRLFVPTDPAAGFLFVFVQQGPGTLSVHRVDGEGKVRRRPILTGKHADAVVRVSGGGTRVARTSPLFGRDALVGLTPQDELYYGWSEVIDFTFYDLTGKWVGVYRADAPAIPVKARDIEHELEGASEMRRQALEGAEHPKTKPALHTVIMDDRSWIWTGRYTADPTMTRWWVYPRKGQSKSAILSLPADIELKVVRDGHAYAVSVDDVGFPTVVRYVINTKGTVDQ